MPSIRLETRIAAPPERCFDLSRDVSVHTSSTGNSERAIAGVTEGLLELGNEVTFEASHFGIRWRMTSKITEYERPRRFADEMQRGPFRKWRHLHFFEPENGGTRMIDRVDYFPIAWPISWIVDRLFLNRFMTRLMTTRNRHIQKLAEGTPIELEAEPSNLSIETR
jgi:ligand-binding SRPBCC domain-containing protein